MKLVISQAYHRDEIDRFIRQEFGDVFGPIPPVDELPTDDLCRIPLIDATKTIESRSYASPCKYQEAWSTIIADHLQAGRIRPSSSHHASPSFLIPKADPAALPRWVIDYRQLNRNVRLDKTPLPRIDDILADAAKGRYWAKFDMTNSFFQTRMHPEDVPLTATSTPLGLFEWTVMPMGFKNSPQIHQRRMRRALAKYVGKFCHVYLDDIIVWLSSLEEHLRNLRLILNAVRAHKLFLNAKKSVLCCTELNFLGHIIGRDGIRPDGSKVERVLNWPVPHSAKDVRRFLGLVRYLDPFLPQLARHAEVLNKLTGKECNDCFPEWLPVHQRAFDAVKSLVTSADCLTTIDHESPGDNNIYVTCDASEIGTGAVLSFGPTWESARPVAFYSKSLKDAECHYPTHEKEMLAIVRALRKWRADLIDNGEQTTRVCMLVNRTTQYHTAVCLALSSSAAPPTDPATPAPGSRLGISIDASFLDSLRQGYDTDPWIRSLAAAAPGMASVVQQDGLWFIDGRLAVPDVPKLRETIFRLCHDSLGHWGFRKSYDSIRSSFYWPGMRSSLESCYIPACDDCQRNKDQTRRTGGPLHPLPVPAQPCSSIAMDFVGPLPVDDSFDTILTITDRLGSDVRFIPCHSTATASDVAELFFTHWYCENGLPLDIVSDRDKLFVSSFWSALNKLTGVSLKLSSSFHPQTDGSSERTNKTLIQALRFHVGRRQKGWAKNGAFPFAAWILPSGDTSPSWGPQLEASPASSWLDERRSLVADAQDALQHAKIIQAANANSHRPPDPGFSVGDRVMLSTKHRRHAFKNRSDGRAVKFFARWDGPYVVKAAHPETSSYTLDIPESSSMFPTFHASLLKPYRQNDDSSFPHRAHLQPPPLTFDDGSQEYFIRDIIDEKRRGRGRRYLVRWKGYGPEHDTWLPGRELVGTHALDDWISSFDLDNSSASSLAGR
ncbi:hypothetical protein H1R20_g1477, partial [Candolleomyces eurysporus]